MQSDLTFEPMPKSYKVMIVEDDESDLFLLTRMLRKIYPDVQVMAASCVQDAYSVYMKSPLDLILLDLNLPDGYGPSTVREVRRFNRVVPIVVVTGLGTHLTILEALKNGANDVLLKAKITDGDFSDTLRHIL